MVRHSSDISRKFEIALEAAAPGHGLAASGHFAVAERWATRFDKLAVRLESHRPHRRDRHLALWYKP
jgi:hypothetical protein